MASDNHLYLIDGGLHFLSFSAPIDFFPQPEFVKHLIVPGNNFAAPKTYDTSAQKTLDFASPISDNDVNDLINQLDLSKLSNKSQDDFDSYLDGFFRNLYDQINSNNVLVQLSQLNDRIKSTQDVISAKKSKIKEKQITLASLNARLTTLTVAEKQQLSSVTNDISTLQDQIRTLETPLVEEIEQENRFSVFYSSIFGDSNDYITPINKNVGTYGKFGKRFIDVLSAVYQSLPKNESINRGKNSGGVTPEGNSNTSISEAGVEVQENQKELEIEVNRSLAQNQIITIVNQSGTNLFVHPPFEQVMSILDVMRDESDLIALQQDISVQQNATLKPLIKNDQSACSKIFSKFSASDINKMISALEVQLAQEEKNIQKQLIEGLKILGSGSMQFLLAHSNFNASDVTKLITGGSLVSGAEQQFEAIKNGISEAKKAIGNLNYGDMATKFGQSVLDKTGISASINAWKAASANAQSIDFKAIGAKVDAELLAQCQAFSDIQANIKNPGDATKEMEKLKSDVNQKATIFGNVIQKAQASSLNASNIQSILTTLKGLVP